MYRIVQRLPQSVYLVHVTQYYAHKRAPMSRPTGVAGFQKLKLVSTF